MREAPDFDTRPGEPLRSTIALWVSRCNHCQFCSADLSHIHQGGDSVVKSSGYRALLENSELNAKAREFLCYSSVLEHAGQYADAGWSALHAAWTCDDAADHEGAAYCRRKALSLWREGKSALQNFGDDVASEFALAADVYRRAGEFENAVLTVSAGLDMEELDPAMSLMLRRQKALIEARDRGAHKLSELR